MALDTDEDLELFFQDDGVRVSFDNGVTYVDALREEYDEKVNEGQMGGSSIGRIKAITVRAVDAQTVQMSGLVRFEGVTAQYRVRDIMQIQDGKFTHILLKDQVVV